MVWNCQTAGPVWEGPVHRNQFHFEDRQLHSSGQLWNTVSPICNFLCANVESRGNICMVCVFPLSQHEIWLCGIKQRSRAEENWRDWSHRGHEESGQAGNKLFLRWETFYTFLRITFYFLCQIRRKHCRWSAFDFVLCSLPPQSCPTPLTGSCPLTTWTWPWCIPARTSWGSSTSTSPGSWAEHGPCRRPPLRRPWRFLPWTTSTWPGWWPAGSKDVTSFSEQQWKCSTRGRCCWQEEKWFIICSRKTFSKY